jgi:beta-barrel assembly-enhancing protease
MFSRRFWLATFLSLLLTISIGLLTPQPSEARSWLDLLFRGVQVLQLSNLSNEQEISLGQQIDRGLLQSGKIALVQDENLRRYLNEIGQRLAVRSDRPELPYTFQVVNDNSINAFATMGGFVYIHTGLMRSARNEAELASVIAHEIGHITGRHAINQLRNTTIARGLLSASGLDSRSWARLGLTLAYELPNSRQDELEADQLGLENLILAGYAPSAMVTFMEQLGRAAGSPPAILSTHPATGERVARLREAIAASGSPSGGGLDSASYRQRIRVLLSSRPN